VKTLEPEISTASQSEPGPELISHSPITSHVLSAPDNLPVAPASGSSEPSPVSADQAFAPNVSEKFAPGELEEELRRIKNDFGVDVQGDQIVGEDDNKKIVANLREALGQIEKKELEDIDMVVFRKQASNVISKGKKISLKCGLSEQEMLVELRKLIPEAKKKQIEAAQGQFEKDVPKEYLGIFSNFKIQMDKARVNSRAQKNVLDLLKKTIIRKDISEMQKQKLTNSQMEFHDISQGTMKYPERIGRIYIEHDRIIFSLGSNDINDPSDDFLERIFILRTKEL
jgi:hypothetical protein